MWDPEHRPLIQRRIVNDVVYAQLIASGMDPVQARIVASRPMTVTEDPLTALKPTLKQLDSPFLLKGMGIAVDRLLLAIEQKQVIAIETDHDCDGQTAHAVLWHALVDLFKVPEARVISFIGHRLEEGYGLSEKLCQRILDNKPVPHLVITADNGSSDEPRIKKLKDAGIDTIVTDHHQIPRSGVPHSAIAVINPNQEGCDYPDKCIAGCFVAWLFMAATRNKLIEQSQKRYPSLSMLLDFVAVGTVADCVSLARSQNNRAVVNFGMAVIEQRSRACWRALELTFPLRAESLGFQIGPLLNSDGRLNCAMGSVSFLLSKTDAEAKAWVVQLQTHNQTRKGIQKKLFDETIAQLEEVGTAGQSICLYMTEGHPGVHGIVASRLKDRYGKPVILFSPKQGEEEIITGSARGVEGFHVQEALTVVAQSQPDLMLGFGGHQGAAGVSLMKADFDRFRTAFEAAAIAQLGRGELKPIILTDGELPLDESLQLLVTRLENNLEPFGREFEAPTFEAVGKVQEIKPVGDGTHAKMTLDIKGQMMDAIWFQFRMDAEAPFPVTNGDLVRIVLSPKNNTFRGQTNFNPHILYCEPVYTDSD